jgi:MFS family permease
MISASSPTFAAVGVFAALWSFGVGGNLPVDSAVFLEFLPPNKQWLLSVLSVDWALAQVLAAGVAWPLIGTMTCSKDEPCTRKANMGWRYFVITMGAVALLMFICRFFFFTIYESPKYLMGKGRDEEAVRIVQEVARRNGTTSTLTIDDLKACEPAGYEAQTDARAALKRKLESVNGAHVRQLFKTRKLAFSTALLICIWAFIGLAYPLYNAFLPYIQENNPRLSADFEKQTNTTYTTYRNMLIIASLGVPGAIIGGLLTETRAGRRGVLGIATALVGVFLFASTTANKVNTLLAWNCMYNFFSVSTSEAQLTPVRHVRRAVRVHARAVPHRVAGHGQRAHREREPYLWRHGAHHCHVRRPLHPGARVRLGSALHPRRLPRLHSPVRVARHRRPVIAEHIRSPPCRPTLRWPLCTCSLTWKNARGGCRLTDVLTANA